MANRMLNAYLCLEFLSITKELIVHKKGLYFFIIVNPIPRKIEKNIAKIFSTLQLMIRKQLIYYLLLDNSKIGIKEYAYE